jgi:hypothetical protein
MFWVTSQAKRPAAGERQLGWECLQPAHSGCRLEALNVAVLQCRWSRLDRYLNGRGLPFH